MSPMTDQRTERPDLDRLRRQVMSLDEADEAARYIEQLEAEGKRGQQITFTDDDGPTQILERGSDGVFHTIYDRFAS